MEAFHILHRGEEEYMRRIFRRRDWKRWIWILIGVAVLLLFVPIERITFFVSEAVVIAVKIVLVVAIVRWMFKNFFRI